MNIKEVISGDIDVPVSMINAALIHARQQVKRFAIPKRNGKQRIVVQPSKKLKTIQYWLIINIFEKMAVHDAAIAYRDGKSILDNAKLHRENRFFLKLDFKDFFPSIKFSDLIPRVIHWRNDQNLDWDLDIDAQELIRLACFYHGDTLAVGYPSSPVISNIVMFDFDTSVLALVSDKDKYGDMVYTRYADDLVFSTNKQGVSQILLKAITSLISIIKSPNIALNTTKTKIGSSSGGTASVTGLKICNDGHITIHRNQKDHIRLLLSLYRKGALSTEEHDSLLGHLAYAFHVDSAFYTKLQGKYFKEITELRAKSILS
ncbi:retron St85 family RNA-directed DNA polymerase [Methylotenera sp.]|uniref:retron St85 family RNA-directed DNA polymerase n=1 Tax=Methylotenera sp. TaxID=2051956 RepID=UPI0024884A76|nr:retron St85 family RNA-directed DNA polymerase [Methylotenera sp.]MDI1361218.1 retron St85 family RNA-directed DNA polymerase [Methylotenera sp.]